MNRGIVDWDVEISGNLELKRVKPLNSNVPHTRLKPTYDNRRHLFIIIPAASMEEAIRRAQAIARQINDSGIWGTEIWNTTSFLASIEHLL